MKLEKVIAPTDVVLADENLRNCRPAVGSLDHQLARLTPIIDWNLTLFDAFRFEQRFGSPAIGAICLCIDLDGHDRSSRRYLGKVFNASTGSGAPRAPNLPAQP